MKSVLHLAFLGLLLAQPLGCSLLVGNYESDAGQQDGGCTGGDCACSNQCGSKCCAPNEQCNDDKCCALGQYKDCKDGDVWWFDSCDNPESVAIDCPNSDCENGGCKVCTPDCQGKDCGLDGCGQPCGSAECPNGSSCNPSGHCICTATNNQPPCGSICCPHGFACDEQNKCGCDADHPLSCGSACCPPGDNCILNTCCTPKKYTKCEKINDSGVWGIYWFDSCNNRDPDPIVTCTNGCDSDLNLCLCLPTTTVSNECQGSQDNLDLCCTKVNRLGNSPVCAYPSCYQDVETCQSNPSSILTQCADDDRVCGLTSNCPVYCGTCPESQECDDKGQCCLPQDRCPTNCCPSGTFCLGTSCGMY